MTAKAPQPRLPELAATLARAMPALDRDERQLALAVYRELAGGEPVDAGVLAQDLGRDREDIVSTLERWPGVFFNGTGDVVSFWGLAIPEMPHRFRVGARDLYTWCAWDALFIPRLIGRPAEVASRSPGSDGAVRLVVAPEGLREVVPETAVVSMLAPSDAFDRRVMMRFCHFVHFFTSAAAGNEWTSRHAGTFLLSVNEAHELGRLVNRQRFGPLLDEDAAAGRPAQVRSAS